MNSEARNQQNARLNAAARGGVLWRNNVGATRHACPHCGRALGQPVRYGLANESAKLNQVIKSSDLIGITPLLVTPGHVGQCVGQFTSVEVKPSEWRYTGRGRETAQRAWLDLVIAHGGIGVFYNGNV